MALSRFGKSFFQNGRNKLAKTLPDWPASGVLFNGDSATFGGSFCIWDLVIKSREGVVRRQRQGMLGSQLQKCSDSNNTLLQIFFL